MISIALVLALQVAAPLTSPSGGSLTPAATTMLRANTLQAALKTDDRKECRAIIVTGSRIPTTECHTSIEWKRLSEGAEDVLGEMQRRGSTCAMGFSGACGGSGINK